ncbi:exosortase-dependent surface protein XDP1 [Aliiglaciecola sp. M165]|uniref:exosortase-dependent surface protein XDP1 n=1 Tax=Aliiglaciecola sp. M165 TaxID=2593649 RepID=UPI00117F5404|nr:exosortase-dependent surface protein XDP1 [Aliiglaciecola sp. M165]TRY29492.1 PEP-CTERM sorting domain-containing protein [Aliiglaciecola sp. M165]
MLKKALTGIFALTLASYANASTTTFTTQNWDFSSNNVSVTGGSSNSQINMSAGGVNVKVTAWSSTGEGACNSGPECGNTFRRDTDPFIERAQLTNYSSGLGAINEDESDNSPNHAIDSRGQNRDEKDFDMVLFSFDEAVELTAINIGWTGGYDSDASILGYQGGTDLGSTPFSGNTKWSDLLNQGWDFRQDSFNIGVGSEAVSSGFESKYWLVGVYNPVFGGSVNHEGNDVFKLRSISTQLTHRTEVPEPATFALLLAGVAAVFRRKTKA